MAKVNWRPFGEVEGFEIVFLRMAEEVPTRDTFAFIDLKGLCIVFWFLFSGGRTKTRRIGWKKVDFCLYLNIEMKLGRPSIISAPAAKTFYMP